MELKDYFGILWRRKWIVLVTILAALAVAIVGTAMTKQAYQASATVRIAAAASGPLNFTASTYSNQLINTAAHIAASQPMLDQVTMRLNLKEVPVITAAVVPETELIKITVEYSSPQMAAQIANTLAEMLISESNQVYTGGKVASQDVLAQQLADYKVELDQTRKQYEQVIALTPLAPEKVTTARDLLELKQRNYDGLLLQYNDALLEQQVRSSMMTVVEPADSPKSPIRPLRTYNYLVGLAIGLLVGVVLAFVAESFDSTLYRASDIENTAALPILARIPKAPKDKLHMASDDQSPLAESFRNLALNLMLGDHGEPGKVVLILSAESQQGKSTVTANLATALAEFGNNTVVIDCDMRRPQLHQIFDLPNESGLRNILEGDSDLRTELRHPTDCVSVITSGGQATNPSHLLNSPNMGRLISDLMKQFDIILLDTPALLAVSDATTIAQNIKLAQNADSLILVVRQGHAQREPVRTAGKFIEKLPHQSAGIVLNQADPAVSSYYYQPAKA